MLIRVRKFSARCFMAGSHAVYMVRYGSSVLWICLCKRKDPEAHRGGLLCQ